MSDPKDEAQAFSEHLALCTREFSKKLQEKGPAPYVIVALGPGDLVGMMGNVDDRKTSVLLTAALAALGFVPKMPNEEPS